MKNIIKEIKKHTNVRSPPRSKGGGGTADGASTTTTPASTSKAAATAPAPANELSPLLVVADATSSSKSAVVSLSRMEEGDAVVKNNSNGSNRTVTFDSNTTCSDNNISPPPPPIETNSNNNNNSAPSSSSNTFSGYNKREVEFDYGADNNHLAVMLQIYGSVWPHVLPWCIITVLWTSLVIWLKRNEYINLTIQSSTGHNFMSILVSFLVVTRATITYNRFMEALQHLTDLFRSAREVIQYSCLFTNQNTNPAAQEWRREVAYQTIVLVRVAIAAVEYRSHGINIWDTVLLDDDDHQSTEFMMSPQKQRRKNDGLNQRKTTSAAAHNTAAAAGTTDSPTRTLSPRSEKIALHSLRHGPRTLTDEHFRAPIVWTYNLRETILQPRNNNLDRGNNTILSQRDWHVNEAIKLLNLVSDFSSAFHGLKKLVTTPFPFPLVQMTRTFLFAWVFTLPLVLIGENNTSVIEVLILTFFCTYGFLGLEYVNMELDDPYGDDPNDFPVRRWAEQVFEDIYIAIYKTDGYDSATRLRSRVTERMARGTVWDNDHQDSSSI